MFERIDKTYDGNSLCTPSYIVEWLNWKYYFDIDLAASDDNHLFDLYLTEENDAIRNNWRDYGVSGFCNPPYSRGNIEKFIKKAIEQANLGFKTVMLIPELNGEARSKEIMLNTSRIYHFDKRINFIHPVTGKECKGNSRGSIVAVFDQKRRPADHVLISLDNIKSQYA